MRQSRPLTACLLTVAFLQTAALSGALLDPAAAAQETGRSESYRAGQRALESESWSQAAEHFAEAAAQGGQDADGALYWQAYALLRLNRGARAQLALESLFERFPTSSWVDDGRALEMEIRRSDRHAPDPDAVSGEELKLIALNALVHLEWDRARPHLEQFLAGASPKMRERALFVLSQSDAPEAREMLVGVAGDPGSPELASEAVRYLAFYDDPETVSLLRTLYAETPHVEVKESALEAMMIAEDLEGLLPIARSEPDEELRQTAVEQLGILGAAAELRQLYGDESSLEVKQQILEALMLAGDKETLLRLARTEPDQELRGTAIEQLGFLEAGPELRELYRNESSAEAREQIAEALGLAQDTDFLIDIARNDADPEVRRRAIEKIGLFGSPAARSALSALYEDAADVTTRRWIIHSFMYQDDAATLIEIARTDPSPELRREAVEVLAMMDSEAATEFLIGILEEDQP